MLRIHRRQQPALDPAAQALDIALSLGVQQIPTLLRQLPTAEQQLTAEHLGNVRMLPRDSYPRRDVSLQPHHRIIALAQYRRGLQQRLDKPEQHLGVEVLLAL